MLNITITPTAIYFNNLTDDLRTDIKKRYPDLTLTPKGKYAVIDKPEKLFRVILELSYTYDLEIV